MGNEDMNYLLFWNIGNKSFMPEILSLDRYDELTALQFVYVKGSVLLKGSEMYGR